MPMERAPPLDHAMLERLCDTLGTRACGGCGFRDMRALTIRHIRRPPGMGRDPGIKWERYLSDPGLAARELRVLCLNCDSIRQPEGESDARSGPRRFPRS